MKTKRIISMLLSVVMLIGAFGVAAYADGAQSEPLIAGIETTSGVPTLHYFTGQTNKIKEKEEDSKSSEIEYVATGDKVIYTREDKLAHMELRMRTKDGYCLYVDEYSGEVAVYCETTGESLFTNPYNIGDSIAVGDDKTPGVKGELMSQLVVNFTDISGAESTTYYSYEWAAQRGQINVRDIKNGIRVEYTIGREEARMLVPCLIEKSSFETKIKDVMSEAVKGDRVAEFQLDKLMACYELIDPATISGDYKAQMLAQYKILNSGVSIYALDTTVSQTEKATIEQFIKTYCPEYTYEQLDDDHMAVGYEAEDKNPPLFKMALEYTLDSTGVTVRLPANGIRFNEALYQLNYIQILPYMGAGTIYTTEDSLFQDNNGYTFFPDGSGALFEFDKIAETGQFFMATGKVYGDDYAYHTITSKHEEVIRYPVYGIVQEENLALIEAFKEARESAEAAAAASGGTVTATSPSYDEEELAALIAAYQEANGSKYKDSSGFVAIVEEGDALMELTTNHDIGRHDYNSVMMKVYPRPQDTYNIADSISVSNDNTDWTVVSSRKYTGNYKVKYIMLTDNDTAAENTYSCDYMGMAKAYRAYLENSGVLTKLTENDVKEDIPLYIETFGALTTTERFLSIPMEVMTPLTTFDDIQTMYSELSAEGIDNINFILTGYTKGGLSSPQVPYNLKWDSSVSDDVDFEDLVEDARSKGYGIYPDFDFAYTQSDEMFDGLTMKKHAVKTIDDRYTLKSEYSATKQTYVSYFDLAISPAYFSHFYLKLTEKYNKYNPIGISVSTLGSDLNSDFDEDEPYNREDSKKFTISAFEYFDQAYDGNVMTSAANAYTWKYVDYITDIALDSSRYSQAWASVPFLGIVLHGYVQYAGTALNMEGNIDYALLKAIENGASINFILSYRNTNNLKNSGTLSQYYSVRYDIWFDDVVEIYNELNGVLAGVQTSTIEHHEFISDAYRVPDNDELEADAARVLDAVMEGREAYEAALEEYRKDTLRNAKLKLDALLADITADKSYTSAKNDWDNALKADAALATKRKAVEDAIADFKTVENDKNDVNYNTYKNALSNAAKEYANELKTFNNLAKTLLQSIVDSLQNVEAARYYYNILEPNVQANYDMSVVDNYHLNTIGGEPASIASWFAYYNNELASVYNEARAYMTSDAVSQFEGTDKAFAEGALSALVPELVAYVFADVTAEDYVEVKDNNVIKNKDYTADDVALPEDNTSTEPMVYAVDANKIVYEVYSNGTEFLLNFNNYQVVVNVNGVSYTLDAYGYIVLKQGN